MIQYTQLRIRRSTNKKLRLCGALTDEKLIDLIDRLVTQEIKKVNQDKEQDEDIDDVPIECPYCHNCNLVCSNGHWECPDCDQEGSYAEPSDHQE